MGFFLPAMIAAAGVGLAGIGILKGGSDVGSAAKRVSKSTDSVLTGLSKDVTQLRASVEGSLKHIQHEVTEIRTFLTNTAWPELNKTLIQAREVLTKAETFLDTSTFTVKVFALLLALCAAFVVSKIISERTKLLWQQRGRQDDLGSVIQNLILQVMYLLCMTIAIVLTLQLLRELVQITWLDSVPLIILIPSLTTLGILYQHLVFTIKAVLSFLLFIPYILVELPILLVWQPIVKVSAYTRGIILNLWLSIIILALYSLVPLGAYILYRLLVNSEKSHLKCILIGYAVTYTAAIAISLMGTASLKYLIRPVWAFLARRR